MVGMAAQNYESIKKGCAHLEITSFWVREESFIDLMLLLSRALFSRTRLQRIYCWIYSCLED